MADRSRELTVGRYSILLDFLTIVFHHQSSQFPVSPCLEDTQKQFFPSCSASTIYLYL
jgi:hypothetical protein